MRTLDLDDLPVVGALDRVRSADGITFRRSPAWTRSQITDPVLTAILTTPAGVRLEFATASTVVELDVMLLRIESEVLPPNPVVFDLVVGGELVQSLPVEGGTVVRAALDGSLTFLPGGPSTVRFNALPGDLTLSTEIWFPQGAVVELRGVRVDDGESLSPLELHRPRWAHHGSSISHGVEAPSPTTTWPALVAREAGVDLVDLAYAGNCLLDQHVARTIRDLQVELISIKAGVNVVNFDAMRERTYVPALHGFLDTVRDGHPTTPIVLATPIVFPDAEDRPGPTTLRADGWYRAVERGPELNAGALTMRRVRELMGAVVTSRRNDGDDNLHLVDGLALLGPDDANLLRDGLHPDGAGHRLIAERFHRIAFGAEGPFGGREAAA